MKRKLCCIFMACLVVAGLFLTTQPVQAKKEGLYTYEVEKGEAIISGVEDVVLGDLVIPSTLGGYPVTAIEEIAFHYKKGLTSVVIPEGVRTINLDAFGACPDLTSVTLPDSLQKLGNGAFEDCEKLNYTVYGNGKYLGNRNNPYLALAEPVSETEAVNVHKNTKVISESFRYNNVKLSVEAGNRYYSTDSAGVLFNAEKTLLYYAPETLSGSYTVPQGVQVIGYRAFDDCKQLTAITLPDSVTVAEGYAFANCTELTTVTLGNGLKSLGADPFCYCSKLAFLTYENGKYLGSKENPYLYLMDVVDNTASSFRFHENVRVIGYAALAGCNALTELVVPDSVVGIDEQAFQACYGLEKLTIGKGVTTIGKPVFRYTTSLTQVIVSADNPNYSSDGHVLMNKEGTVALQAPEGLVTYTMPDSVQIVDEMAFWHCDNLSGITLGKGLREIWYEAFGYCEQLTELTVPGNVKTIGEYAFAECEKLAKVILEEGVADVGTRAFRRCRAMASLTLPDSLRSIGYEAFVGCDQMESVLIPKGVSKIEKSAFFSCSKLTEILVSEENAYYSSYGGVLYNKDLTCLLQAPYAIEQHTLPSSVKVIGASAFFECRSIRSLILPEGLTTIEGGAFYDCGIGSLIIPASVTTVESSAFEGVGLRFLGDAPEVIGSTPAVAMMPWYKNKDIWFPADNATWTEEAKARICDRANWLAPVAHEITEGANTQITPEQLDVTIGTKWSGYSLVGVQVDGSWLLPEAYTDEERTRIVFSPEYLATLKSGTHQVSLLYVDGDATTTLTVIKNLKGDLDGKDDVSVDDAIYLLQHVLMPELFAITEDVDYNANGAADVDDAIYLLQHVLMPELFPL